MLLRTIRAVALIAVLALAGSAGLSVIAGSGAAQGDETQPDSGLMHSIHRLGQQIHGVHGHHAHDANVIDRLQLTPEQTQRIERVQELMLNHGGSGSAGMAQLHDKLVAQYEQGPLSTDELHGLIDDHLEQTRALFYGVTDELAALLNELDETQRATLVEHLRQAGGVRGLQSH